MTLRDCAKAPCKSCPYRKDVPSGVWAASEYKKLPDYDGEIVEQLLKNATALFDCHQQDGKLCAGWIGCHGAINLLACRLRADGLDPSVWTYKSPVPLFASGSAACAHGKRAINKPGIRARSMAARLLRTGQTTPIKRERGK